MKILIADGTFNESDFSDDGQELYIHIQTESCDEYDPEINHVREKHMFKLRNAKHIFKC